MNLMSIRPFHLAFPVRDIAEARQFYGDQLGLAEGRSSDTWVDFNLFGHQADLFIKRRAYTVNYSVVIELDCISDIAAITAQGRASMASKTS